jgi:hypothetical protein
MSMQQVHSISHERITVTDADDISEHILVGMGPSNEVFSTTVNVSVGAYVVLDDKIG